MKRSRTDGEAVDRKKPNTNNISMQELASAGLSAIDSFGTEPGGEVVYVDISIYPDKPQTFKLRCGLASDGSAL
ncbi:MAG TPA: hypothetical protein VGQ76_15335 [Thermoanaerobaculia bacterium]|jgi:hypothetical protein|nr:hypothetical protein [Thermoanaerobaculia bacterium]